MRVGVGLAVGVRGVPAFGSKVARIAEAGNRGFARECPSVPWSRTAPRAEVQRVGRTNYVILAIGAIGCLALSLMMQHAVDVQREAVRPELAKRIEAMWGTRLVDHVEVREEDDEDGVRLRLALPTTSLFASARFARDVGDMVWGVLGVDHEVVAVEVLLEVRDRSERGRTVGYRVFPAEAMRAPERLGEAGESSSAPARPDANRAEPPPVPSPRGTTLPRLPASRPPIPGR
jgi:hypothetical protein